MQLRKDVRVASLASVPSREQCLYKAVKSLRAQVDRINVYLNLYPGVPKFLEDFGCTVALSQDYGDRGDSGKFFWSGDLGPAWHITCDDDFIYTPGYVDGQIEASLRLRGPVSLHGVLLSDELVRGHEVDWLKLGRKGWWRAIDRVNQDIQVHIVGTGVACYHTSHVRVDRRLFRSANSADIWFSATCKDQGVACFVRAHPPELAVQTAPPLAAGPKQLRDSGEYSRRVASCSPWRLPSRRDGDEGPAVPVTVVSGSGAAGYASVIREALSRIEGAVVSPGDKAKIVVIVGDIDDDTSVKAWQKLVWIILPSQRIPVEWLSRKDVRWVSLTPYDAARFTDAVAEHGAKADVQCLEWTCFHEILRHSSRSGRMRVAFGGKVSVPAGVRVVDENDHADVLFDPSSLLTLLPALHRGTPVFIRGDRAIATYVAHGVTGTIVDGPEGIASALSAVLTHPRSLRDTTVGHPGLSIARQSSFVEGLRETFLGARHKVIFVHGKKKVNPLDTPMNNRGIRYQTLDSFGAHVSHVSSSAGIPSANPDLIMLGGRVPPERIAALAAATAKPIVLAMNDAIVGDKQRVLWFKEVGKLVSLMFVGEPPRLLPSVSCEVVQLHQSPHLGLTRPRPFMEGLSGPANVCRGDLSFFANHWYRRRTDLISQIASQVPLHIVGARNPSIKGTVYSGVALGDNYVTHMQQSSAVLSSSICRDREVTSVRLFDACGVGAYVIAESFPNCRSIYPDSCVDWFDTWQDAVTMAREAIDNPMSSRILEMRWSAQEYTWRNYSPQDRMATILSAVREKLGAW